jgi:spermidine synthase
MDLASGLSIHPYVYSVSYLSHAVHPAARSALVVGCGAGLIPRWFEQMGVRTDVVDIDPEVVRLAREWFGFRVSGEVAVDDARHFLQSTARSWDRVVLDVFTGDVTPAHLLSREALESVAARLAPGGIVAANVIAATGPDRFVTASIVRTFRAVFPHVEVFRVSYAEDLSNLTVVASRDRPIRPDPRRVAGLPFHALASQAEALLFETIDFPPDEPAVVLTDDHNPADARDQRARAILRERILSGTALDLLL